MSILDSELADTLADALNAFDIPQVCTITRNATSGSPFNPTLTPTDYTSTGWRDTYSAEELRDSTVLVTDVKVYVLAPGALIEPRATDTITIGGHSYQIINVQRDPAGAAWVCQCRA